MRGTEKSGRCQYYGNVLRALVVPVLGAVLVTKLRTAQIENWMDDLANTPPRVGRGKNRIRPAGEMTLERRDSREVTVDGILASLKSAAQPRR